MPGCGGMMHQFAVAAEPACLTTDVDEVPYEGLPRGMLIAIWQTKKGMVTEKIILR